MNNILNLFRKNKDINEIITKAKDNLMLYGKESFLLLGIIMGVIGLLGAIISLVDISEYSKYMSAQSIKETKTMEQKYQKELKTYNNEIDKMNAVPKFKGNISSNKKVKIPSRIDEN